ncbi:MAG: hypothetical protein NUV77_13370 [Thermoguttaceae bacterium]|jgi:hypothetical protein|nr:hypothetical protein [Thermoguttaceae bacterium]
MIDREPLGRPSAALVSRQPPRSVCRATVLRLAPWVLTLCLAVGCSTFHLPGFSAVRNDPPRRSQATHQFRKPKKEEKSWLASWFGPKEPPPPKSVREWMRQNKQMRLPPPEAKDESASQ